MIGKVIAVADEGFFGCRACDRQWRLKDRNNNFAQTKCSAPLTEVSRSVAVAPAGSGSRSNNGTGVAGSGTGRSGTTMLMKRLAAVIVRGRRVARKTVSPRRGWKAGFFD